MPSSCRPAGRIAPSSDAARVHHPLPSRTKPPSPCERTDRRAGCRTTERCRASSRAGRRNSQLLLPVSRVDQERDPYWDRTRFVRSIKFECLHRVIPLGERHLRRAIREYVAHYNHERNHQGLDNELIVGVASPRGAGTVRCLDPKLRIGWVPDSRRAGSAAWLLPPADVRVRAGTRRFATGRGPTGAVPRVSRRVAAASRSPAEAPTL